jgi:hypothetical protein
LDREILPRLEIVGVAFPLENRLYYVTLPCIINYSIAKRATKAVDIATKSYGYIITNPNGKQPSIGIFGF